jgi:hypothetical protein
MGSPEELESFWRSQNLWLLQNGSDSSIFFYREVAPPIKHLIELLQRGDGAGEEPFQTNPIFI